MSDVSEMRKRNAKDSVGHSCDGMAASADRRELLSLYDALAAENASLTRLIAAYVNAVETGLDAHAASGYLEMRLIRNAHDRLAVQPSEQQKENT